MKWNTKITKVEPDHLVTRGYRQEDLIGNIPYSHVVYLLLKGDLPSKEHGRMIDAILTACIDHGVTPPSSIASRTVASGGVPLPTAVAAGILSIGDAHGGAIEKGAKLIVLGCTEIPLAFNPNRVTVPVVNATEVLANAAIKMYNEQ